MSALLSSDLELPAGTMVSMGTSGAVLLFTWRSVRGLHIIRSEIPMRWCKEEGYAKELYGAVQAFKEAISAEVMGEVMGAFDVN